MHTAGIVYRLHDQQTALRREARQMLPPLFLPISAPKRDREVDAMHPVLPNCSSLYIGVKAPKVDEEEGRQMSSVKDTVFRELPGLIMESITKDSAANAQSICETVAALCAVATPICSNGEVFQAALLAFGVNSRYKREWLEMQTVGHLSDPPTSDRVLFNHICNRLSDAFKEIQLGYDTKEDNYNHSPNDAKPPRDRHDANMERQLNVDHTALKRLGTIGGDRLDKVDLVVAWRRLVSGCRYEDYYLTRESRSKRYYLLPDSSKVEWLYNFAWVMAELFDPGQPYIGLERPLSVDHVPGFTSAPIWGAEHWIREWIRKRVPEILLNEEPTTGRDIYYMIYEDMFLGVLDRDFAPNRMRIRTEIKAEIIRYNTLA